MATKKLAFGGMSKAIRPAVNKAVTQIRAMAPMAKKPQAPLSGIGSPAIMKGLMNQPGMEKRQPLTGAAADAQSAMAKKLAAQMAAQKAGRLMKKGGMAECKTVAKKEVKSHEKRMHGMAKGGSIDGCAIRGKTKTSMVKMKRGGSC